MKLLLGIVLLFVSVAAKSQGQNLLLNGSFEEQYNCPNTYGQLENALYWNSPNYKWYNSFVCTCTTLYDSCATDALINVPNNPGCGGLSQSGHAYAGFYPLNLFYDTLQLKMYLQTEISETLKPNVYYCFKMYIKCECYMMWAVNDFSVYFSPDKLEDSLHTVLDYINPQITNTSGHFYTNRDTWEEYTGYFKADGGEKYLTIGSFLPIDSTPKTSIAGQFNAAYYFIDNVQLYECDSLNSVEENKLHNINIYPNPAQDFVSIELPKNISNAQLNIYNLTGQLLYQKQITQPSQNIPIAELGNGMYIFVIQNEDKVIGRQRVVVTR